MQAYMLEDCFWPRWVLFLPVILLAVAAIRRLCSLANRPKAVPRVQPAPATVRLNAAAAHEIQVRVVAACGSAAAEGTEEVSVSLAIDSRCAGSVLAQRAGVALGEVECMWLPDGAELDLQRPLQAQGLQGGEILVALLPRMPAQQVPNRPTKAIRELTYERYFSSCKRFLHRFHLFVHDAEAVAEATASTVEASFDTCGFSLRIRGQSCDFVLRRRVGPKVAALPVPFKVCAERCTVNVVPGKRVELVMKPFPPMWLKPGRRVQLTSLQAAASLNGRCGTIKGFAEPSEEDKEPRYSVLLDNGELKKVRRENLVLQAAEP